MFMGLNIKRKDTQRLAQQVAKLAGENMSEAVTNALRERLHRLQKERGEYSLADELMRIGRECAEHLEEPFRSADHGDLLYDEKGLPK